MAESTGRKKAQVMDTLRKGCKASCFSTSVIELCLVMDENVVKSEGFKTY